jgi:hypothetical protein
LEGAALVVVEQIRGLTLEELEVVAWALTANVWWSLGALLTGVGLVVTAVWSEG